MIEAIKKLIRVDPILALKKNWAVGGFCLIVFCGYFLVSASPESPSHQIGLGGADRFGFGSMATLEESVPADEGLCYQAYIIKHGDNLSKVADDHGVSLDTIISFNDIKNARGLHVGEAIKIPNMSGIMYVAKAGDRVDEIAEKNSISAQKISEVNSLGSPVLTEGQRLFLPDARLSSYILREVSGELFRWPVRGWLSSGGYYGYRTDPLTGQRAFHNGIDIGAEYGTSIGAAMEGTVAETGYSIIYGNYIIVSHQLGYRSFYGHLSKIGVVPGQNVRLYQYLGNVGSTGRSTGSHLHFTVYKWGRPLNPLNVLH